MAAAWRRVLVPSAAGGCALLFSGSGTKAFFNGSLAAPSSSETSRLSSFKTSGILFKDKVKVDRFFDPKVENVVVHVSSVDEGGLSGVFTNSAQTSITATKCGPVRLRQPINLKPEGELVFDERRNWLFKSAKVRRIYDPKAKCLVYVAYSDRVAIGSESRTHYSTSLTAIPIGEDMERGDLFSWPPSKE